MLAAVLYVGDLALMRSFYVRCFELSVDAEDDDFCVLGADGVRLTLVQSALAAPTEQPVPRRSETPIKLVFAVTNLSVTRAEVTAAGGVVDAAEPWEFRGTMHLDCVDPEGNVLQLVGAIESFEPR